MTGSLARYHARSPRYLLDTEDNNLIRFSGAERYSWEEKTELLNISLTGLSFSAPHDLSPQLGEIIKIQFQVPGSTMMACYAVVIRIESINDFQNEIAVHFYKLDRVQRINIVQGLANKIAGDKVSKATQQNKKNWKLKRFGMILFMMSSVLLWITLFKIFWL